MYAKLFGWVLLLLGLGGAMNAYSRGYGIMGTVAMLIVVSVGAWNALLRHVPHGHGN